MEQLAPPPQNTVLYALIGYLLLLIAGGLQAVALVLGISYSGYGLAFNYPEIRLLTLGALAGSLVGGVMFAWMFFKNRSRPAYLTLGLAASLICLFGAAGLLFLSYAAMKTI